MKIKLKFTQHAFCFGSAGPMKYELQVTLFELEHRDKFIIPMTSRDSLQKAYETFKRRMKLK